jgi:hypothetical protein
LPTVPDQIKQQAIDEATVEINSGPSWWDNLVGKVEAGSVGVVIGGAVVIGILIYLSVKSAATV